METWAKYTTPIIYGSAKRMPNCDEDANNNKYSISLKDLSKAQIFRLAEERSKNAGTIRQTPNDFSHKRIAVSENVTRERAPSKDRIAPRNLELTSRSDQPDNDEFFENLLKKMTAEKFIPLGQMDGSKKRTCLWNEENVSNLKKPKRRKENKANAIPVPPMMVPFKERLLSQECNNASSVRMGIQSQREDFGKLKEERRPTTLRRKSASDLIQEDINVEASSSNLIDYGSLALAGKKSPDESFHQNEITDNGSSISSCETIKLRHNCTIDGFNQELSHPIMSYDYYTKPYLVNSNSSNLSCLSTIEEFHEPFVIVPSPVYDVVEFERRSNVSPYFTPPLSPEELDKCDVDNFGITREHTISWELLQALTHSRGDLNATSSYVEKIV